MNQGRNWLIAFQCVALMIHDIAMSVPRLAASVKQLHHPHAAFNQTTSDQAAVREFALAVALSSGLCFAADIESFLSFRLHTVRNLE